MRVIVSSLLVMICSYVNAAEPTIADYNKSVAAVLGGISQLKTAESMVLKNTGEYLHKLAEIRELNEKIRADRMNNDMRQAEDFYAKKELYEKNRRPRKNPVRTPSVQYRTVSQPKHDSYDEIKILQKLLRENVKKMSPMEYIAVKKFLDRLENQTINSY